MQQTTIVDAPADISQDGMTSQVTALHEPRMALHHQPPVCPTICTAVGKGHAHQVHQRKAGLVGTSSGLPSTHAERSELSLNLGC